MSDDDQSFEVRVAQRAPGGDVEALLNRVRELIDGARPAPLSTQQVKVDRDELLDLLDQAIERLPEEVRSARWLMKDRDEFLARTRREADDILAAARGQAERMVQRSEVMKAAEAKARRVLEDARAEASRRRNEADDFCDKRLAQFETVLERTMTVVTTGRAKLRGQSVEASEGTASPGAEADAADDPDSAVFDQDRV
jgi:cell division septum initiation protein DivIVA